MSQAQLLTFFATSCSALSSSETVLSDDEHPGQKASAAEGAAPSRMEEDRELARLHRVNRTIKELVRDRVRLAL